MASWRSQPPPSTLRQYYSLLFTQSRRRRILRNPIAGSCIAPALCSVKCPIAAVLGIGAVTASCGATYVYIVAHKLDAFIRVSSATATLLLVALGAVSQRVLYAVVYGSPYDNHGQGRDVCVWCNRGSTVLDNRHRQLVGLGVRGRGWSETVGYLDLGLPAGSFRARSTQRATRRAACASRTPRAWPPRPALELPTGTFHSFIHSTSWKGNSRNFAFHDFSEGRSSFCTGVPMIRCLRDTMRCPMRVSHS